MILICCRCGSPQVKALGEVFVEDGEFDESTGTYEREGWAGKWGCESCGSGFIEWTPKPEELKD